MPETRRLPPNQQWTRKFPVLGEREPAPGLTPEAWRLQVGGLVQRPFELVLAELKALPQRSVVADIHCVTRWSRADTQWRGVGLGLLLERAGLREDARFVRFVAHSAHGHDTSLPLEICRGGGVLVAHELDGAPLPEWTERFVALRGAYGWEDA